MACIIWPWYMPASLPSSNPFYSETVLLDRAITAAKWRRLFPLIFSPSSVKFFIHSRKHLLLESDLGSPFNLPLPVFIKKYLHSVSFHDAVCIQNSKGCCKVGLNLFFQPSKLSMITHSWSHPSPLYPLPLEFSTPIQSAGRDQEDILTHITGIAVK